MSERLDVLVHAQHLTGVGHFVRARALARELARRHAVRLVDGGSPVPDALPSRAELLELPRIVRAGGALRPLDERSGRGAVRSTGVSPALGDAASIETVLAERAARLAAAVAERPPHVVVLEHFPFSKWELRDEFLGLVAAARVARPDVRIVASLRDVCPRTRQESGVSEEVYRETVCAALGRAYDALLVHTDPRVTRLGDHVPWADALPVPVTETGYVVDPLPPPEPAAEGALVVSVGGGAAGAALAEAAAGAACALRASGDTRVGKLVVFAGLGWKTAERERLAATAAGLSLDVRPFSAEFPGWLAGAALSVSRAGYNTCAQLLAARTPAVLVPDPGMSDQGFRARRLHELGLVELVEDAGVDAGVLAAAMARALERGSVANDIDLDGAARSGHVIEGLVRGG